MRFVKINNDKISKLSLGTVQFGLDYGIANNTGKPSQNNVNEIIDYLFANGLNCFDTAQAYGNSEEVLGKSLGGKNNVHVISKLKSHLFIENCTKNVEQSLHNLNINSLYALLLHDSLPLYDWKVDYSYFVTELKKMNKIKYFGVSIYTNDDFIRAIENEYINFIQIPFNLFDQRALKENWFELARMKNKYIVIRSVFLQGLLVMDKDKIPIKLEKAKEYIEKLDSYCLKKSVTKNNLALSFVDCVAKDALILFGCDNLEQAKENLYNYNNLIKLTKEDIEELRNIFKDVDENIYNPTKW